MCRVCHGTPRFWQICKIVREIVREIVLKIVRQSVRELSAKLSAKLFPAKLIVQLIVQKTAAMKNEMLIISEITLLTIRIVEP